jgi:hypothetical protein
MRDFSPSYSIFRTPTTSPEMQLNGSLSAKRKEDNHGANFSILPTASFAPIFRICSQKLKIL